MSDKEWTIINEDDIATLPSEGVEVLVSDGKNMEVAWYLHSGEYKWMKYICEIDDHIEFNRFDVTEWKALDV
jgi:hypothetical protein